MGIRYFFLCMNLKISLTSAEPFSSVKQYQQRWEIVTALANSERSVRTQTLGAIPVFKPLTGQCTGMAPICIKRDLGWGLGDHDQMI